MKAHHKLGYIIFVILIIVGVFVWVRPETQIDPSDEPVLDPTSEQLQGIWLGEGVYEDGSDWYMRYEFTGSNYTLETDSTYGETGTFEVSNLYEDGTIEIEKTYKEGERVHAMIITIEDEFTFNLEGMTMRHIVE
jgi:hypothetical protein